MIINFLNISKSDLKRILGNIFSLSVLNGINYLFPLILIPYLVRILGVEKYGLYAFSFAVIQYFVLLVNYGFPFSATKLVSVHRNNRERISVIFYSVTISRVILSLISIVIIITITITFPKFRNEYQLYIYGLGIIIGTAINPIWLFQGFEKMKYLAIVNLIAKSLILILIFSFIKTSSQYIYVSLFFSIGFILAGLTSFFMAIIVFKLIPKKPRVINIQYVLKNGFHVFISTLGMNLYRDINTIILGFMFDYSVVGLYSAAEKIIKVVQSLLSPVSQALFPYFGKEINLTKDNKKKSLERLNKIGLIFFLSLLVIQIAFVLFSKKLTLLYLGEDFLPSVRNMKVMSFVIVFGSLNYYYGIIGLINLGYQKQFTKFVMFAGISSLFLSLSLSYFFKDFGASITMSVVELLLFLMIFKFFKDKTKPKYV